MPQEVNLYFATRPGQIRNLCSHINQVGNTSNRLIILTTTNENALRQTLAKTIPDGVFERICWPVLPGHPSDPIGTIKRCRIYSTFKDALFETLRDCEFTRAIVHLFHPSAYYVYIPRILSQMGVNIGHVNMIEEGLSSYKWCALPYNIDTYGAKVGSNNWKPTHDGNIIDAVQHARNKTRALISKPTSSRLAVDAIRSIAAIPIRALSCATRKDIRAIVIEPKDRALPKHLRFGMIDHFDEGWFSRPETMARSKQLSFDRIEHLRPSTPPLSLEMAEIVQNAPSTIFIGQRFGVQSCYIETVRSILAIMGFKEVLYKPHPTEELTLLEEIFATSLHKANEPIMTMDARLSGTATEALIATGHFKHVIGLTSTSFLYAPAVGDVQLSTSIAALFLELYPLIYEEMQGERMPPNHLRLLRRDAEVFAAVVDNVQMPGRDALNIEQKNAYPYQAPIVC